MFSTAYINLQRALRLAADQSSSYHVLRDVLYAAKKEVLEDPRQPDALKQRAASAIDRAITYTYIRPNPSMTPAQFMTMASTPVSPYQRAPAVFSFSQVPSISPEGLPTQWTTQSRELLAIREMILEAINIIRQGLGH